MVNCTLPSLMLSVLPISSLVMMQSNILGARNGDPATFTPPLTITSVTLNGTALTAGTDYTYDGATFRTLTPLLIPAATYTRNATTGEVTITPGTATLVVTGTV